MLTSLHTVLGRLAALYTLCTAMVTASAAEPLGDVMARQQCVLVVSHGKNLSSDDPKYNEFWNKLNVALGQFFRDEIASKSITVHAEFYPVEARDSDAKSDALMRTAIQRNCGSLVQLSAFVNENRDLCVDVTVNRLLVYYSEVRKGRVASVEEEQYSKSYKYPMTNDLFDRFVMSTVAREYAQHMLASSAP